MVPPNDSYDPALYPRRIPQLAVGQLWVKVSTDVEKRRPFQQCNAWRGAGFRDKAGASLAKTIANSMRISEKLPSQDHLGRLGGGPEVEQVRYQAIVIWELPHGHETSGLSYTRWTGTSATWTANTRVEIRWATLHWNSHTG